jgi:hypothetical protein
MTSRLASFRTTLMVVSSPSIRGVPWIRLECNPNFLEHLETLKAFVDVQGSIMVMHHVTRFLASNTIAIELPAYPKIMSSNHGCGTNMESAFHPSIWQILLFPSHTFWRPFDQSINYRTSIVDPRKVNQVILEYNHDVLMLNSLQITATHHSPSS